MLSWNTLGSKLIEAVRYGYFFLNRKRKKDYRNTITQNCPFHRVGIGPKFNLEFNQQSVFHSVLNNQRTRLEAPSAKHMAGFQLHIICKMTKMSTAHFILLRTLQMFIFFPERVFIHVFPSQNIINCYLNIYFSSANSFKQIKEQALFFLFPHQV